MPSLFPLTTTTTTTTTTKNPSSPREEAVRSSTFQRLVVVVVRVEMIIEMLEPRPSTGSSGQFIDVTTTNGGGKRGIGVANGPMVEPLPSTGSGLF